LDFGDRVLIACCPMQSDAAQPQQLLQGATSQTALLQQIAAARAALHAAQNGSLQPEHPCLNQSGNICVDALGSGLEDDLATELVYLELQLEISQGALPFSKHQCHTDHSMSHLEHSHAPGPCSANASNQMVLLEACKLAMSRVGTAREAEDEAAAHLERERALRAQASVQADAAKHARCDGRTADADQQSAAALQLSHQVSEAAQTATASQRRAEELRRAASEAQDCFQHLLGQCCLVQHLQASADHVQHCVQAADAAYIAAQYAQRDAKFGCSTKQQQAASKKAAGHRDLAQQLTAEAEQLPHETGAVLCRVSVCAETAATTRQQLACAQAGSAQARVELAAAEQQLANVQHAVCLAEKDTQAHAACLAATQKAAAAVSSQAGSTAVTAAQLRSHALSFQKHSQAMMALGNERAEDAAQESNRLFAAAHAQAAKGHEASVCALRAAADIQVAQLSVDVGEQQHAMLLALAEHELACKVQQVRVTALQAHVSDIRLQRADLQRNIASLQLQHQTFQRNAAKAGESTDKQSSESQHGWRQQVADVAGELQQQQGRLEQCLQLEKQASSVLACAGLNARVERALATSMKESVLIVGEMHVTMEKTARARAELQALQCNHNVRSSMHVCDRVDQIHPYRSNSTAPPVV
jgi:hypothetical protein